MTILYGIPNCDTVKRARAWLADQGVEYTFHDFKKEGVPAARLDAWLQSIGWETVINRKGTAWRALGDVNQAGVVDAPSAAAAARLTPSIIKRPVVEWSDGTITVGFTPERFAASQLSQRTSSP